MPSRRHTTKMTLNSSTIAVRALNYARREHKPTYVGLRFLLDSLASQIRDRWLTQYIVKRASTRRRQSYFAFLALKGVTPQNRIEYRECFIPSPASLLSEAWLLAELSSAPAFHSSSHVYSYRWPVERSGHIFQHYFRGYSERNHAVAAALGRLPNSVAIVADIKQFYPSLPKAHVERSFIDRLRASSASNWTQRSGEEIVGSILYETAKQGIPVGPPTSHLLAQISLAAVDTALSARYPTGYFRYVDDIVLVVPRDRSSEARATLSALLSEIGLEINPAKSDDVDGKIWSERLSTEERSDGFGKLIDRLVVFLVRRPEMFENLITVFRSADFSLPLSKVRASAEYPRHRAFLFGVIQGLRASRIMQSTSFLEAIHRARTYYFDTPEVLSEAALYLRSEFLHKAENLTRKKMPEFGMQRRWMVQDYRFVFNRLLYLVPMSEYPRLLSIVPTIPELYELRCVLQSLINRSVEPVIRLPGAASRAVAELAGENGLKLQVPGPDAMRDSETGAMWSRDSLSNCGLYNLFALSQNMVDFREAKDRVFVQCCFGQPQVQRAYDDFSYIDEIQTLHLKREHGDIAKALASRFSDSEDVTLDGLLLDGGEYAS